MWQCDTPPEGLRLKAPTGWKAELLQEAEEDDEEGEEETTVRGKAVPPTEEQQGKVKYSRLAKWVSPQGWQGPRTHEASM